MSERTYRCNAMSGTVRCSFTGNNDEAGEHWRETGHARCIVDGSFLRPDETLTCARCIGIARADLADILTAYALLPDVIEHSGFTGRIPVNPLTLYADGSVESPVQQAHPELYRDVEWPTDPTPVIAVVGADVAPGVRPRTRGHSRHRLVLRVLPEPLAGLYSG